MEDLPQRMREEPEESRVKLNDLPELPFEKILGHLSLEERIKARAVSRRWYSVINSFKLKSLCCSSLPSGFVVKKNHWISGEFTCNFIGLPRCLLFVQTFGQSILSSLKHLRLCKLDLNTENTPASLILILNSFDQLEELRLFRIKLSPGLATTDFKLRLNLPMLESLQIVEVNVFEDLTLDAPSLKKVKLFASPKIELVHGESVEKLIIDELARMEVKKMKNLKYLYCVIYSSNGLVLYSRASLLNSTTGFGLNSSTEFELNSSTDSTLLSTLEQLNEIHLSDHRSVAGLFEQKKRYDRSNLKIFLYGCLLNGPSDPAMDSVSGCFAGYLAYLTKDRSKLAGEIPFCNRLHYSLIEAVAPERRIDLLNRFTDLEEIFVHKSVQSVERFLELLKNVNKIVRLDFNRGHQPQELFDRLPDHSTIQVLRIDNAPADLDFLFKLKSLIDLNLCFAIDIEFIPRVFEELPFLMGFSFSYLNARFKIEIDHSKQLTVSQGFRGYKTAPNVFDVNAAVQWIIEQPQPKW